MRLKMYLLIISSALVALVNFSFAQLNDVWYFGPHGRFDFSTDPPNYSPETVIPMDTVVFWCQTQATDEAGNLLYWSNGTTVFNRNGDPMPNGEGLLSSGGLIQVLSIPKPGSSNQSYIFCLDYYDGGENGLTYSLVDMSLDDGLGDLVPGQKNKTLVSGVGNAPDNNLISEIFTAVSHANGKDFWVVMKMGHVYNSEFRAFLITEEGVSSEPVISYNPVTFFPSVSYGGSMTFSHDASRLAICNRTSGNHGIYLYDFDNSTGIISNGFDLSVNHFDSFYGVEFSPDNTKLYGTGWAGVFQFDLATNPIERDLIYAGKPSSMYQTFYQSLLGSDDKIYIMQANWEADDRHVAVVHDPNEKGEGCNFEADYVEIENGDVPGGGVQLFGFPLTVRMCESRLVVLVGANIFTPNNDHLNDEWSFLAVDNVSDLHVRILNRWGGLVFESTDLNPAWDGNLPDGTPVSDGVYFYEYSAKNASGTASNGHGNLTLVRD